MISHAKAQICQCLKTGKSGLLPVRLYLLTDQAAGAGATAFFAARACLVFLACLAFLCVAFFAVAFAGAGVAAGAAVAAGVAGVAGVAGAAGVAAKAVLIAKVAAIRAARSLFMFNFPLGCIRRQLLRSADNAALSRPVDSI